MCLPTFRRDENYSADVVTSYENFMRFRCCSGKKRRKMDALFYLRRRAGMRNKLSGDIEEQFNEGGWKL